MLFHFIQMTKGEERYIKYEIRKLIKAQQDIQLLGGVLDTSFSYTAPRRQ
jgi:hypothetical protein